MNKETEIKNRLNVFPDELEAGLRLLDIFNFLPDATFVIDCAGRVLIWNNAIEELTGVKKDDILGRGDYEYSIPFYKNRRPILIDYILHPEFDGDNKYSSFKRERDVIYGESFTPGIGEKGAYLWSISKPLHDSSGKLIGAIESIRNISELKTANEIIIRQKDELVFVNVQLSEAVNELKKRNIDAGNANRQLVEAREELLKSNELLRSSEEKFSRAFKSSPVFISLTTVAEGRYIDVSDNYYAASGWERDELIGHTVNEIKIWADESERQSVINQIRENGCVREMEIRFRRRNGEVRTMLSSGDIIMVGGVQCFLSMNSDITDRIIAEQNSRLQKIELEKVNAELKRSINEMEKTHQDLLRTQQELMDSNSLLLLSEEKFSKTVHLGPVVITLSRLSDGVYIDASDYFLKLTGYTRDEVVGHSALDLNIWANGEDRSRVMTALKNSEVVRGLEISFCSRDGAVHCMNYSAEVITIAGELHLVSVAVDITERKRAEEEKARLENQLQQSQKMETVGRLAGGIAHDFNNLLTAILGNVELCMMQSGTESALFPRLEMIKKASESAADLTKRILAFSRKQVIQPEVVDINGMITHMHNMLERLIGEDIRLNTDAAACNAKIIADPGQVEQIILNLSVNARDAMPGGGALTIATDNAVLDEEFCRMHAYAVPGEYVLLSISDTGTGMSDEVQKHLFEPFFTTKPRGKGTGLGLSMVYGSVRQNNGIIEVKSDELNGTCFKIYFPLYDGEVSSSQGKHDRSIRFEGKETILLVEDNTMVLDFSTHILEKAGFMVLEAQNGEIAQTLEAAYEGKIDLLLTDVVMPGINGKALAEILMTKRPDMKVILTSGYTEDIIEQQNVSDGLNFISKPYTADSLIKKIRQILDS